MPTQSKYTLMDLLKSSPRLPFPRSTGNFYHLDNVAIANCTFLKEVWIVQRFTMSTWCYLADYFCVYIRYRRRQLIINHSLRKPNKVRCSNSKNVIGTTCEDRHLSRPVVLKIFGWHASHCFFFCVYVFVLLSVRIVSCRV